MEYRNRTVFTSNAELDVLNEIKELCRKERKTLSEKINELFIEELEKKAVGETNPLGISYGRQEEKPSLGTLDAWIRRTDAIQLIKGVDADIAEHIGINMIIAARFKKTGTIRDVRVF